MKVRVVQPFAGSVVFEAEGPDREAVVRDMASKIARLHLLTVLAEENPEDGHEAGVVRIRVLEPGKEFAATGTLIGGGGVRIAEHAAPPEIEVLEE